ncbi:unnamed protein product [Urochloa humidicola]
MSGFVLRRFIELVAQGMKTDKGFKDVYLNKVAKELSEFTSMEVAGNQVYNHLCKWRARWVKICRLKDLSGSNWDEDNFMITLDLEHYSGHVKDHPKDAEFLNVPLVYYVEMQAIFASGVATGRFSMGSNEALGEAPAEAMDVDQDAPAGTEATYGCPDGKAKAQQGSDGVTPSKRKRGLSKEDGACMNGMTEAVWGLSKVIKESIHSEGTPGLVKAVMECSNFTKPQLMFCLDHLMEHKRSGLGFLDMDGEQRDLWLETHLIKNGLLG